MEKDIEYCKCKNSTAVYTEFNDMYQWDVCCDCKKIIEFSIESNDNLPDF